MQIKFDWTISVSTVLTVASAITMTGLAIARILRRFEQKIDRMQQTLRDFPPHRHSGTNIIYPAPLRHDGSQNG